MRKILTLFTTLLLLGSWMNVKAVTYTPAGDPASVFGEAWNPEYSANDMVLSNGLYVFAKRSDFSQTAIQFKVCKDHAWTTAFPESNYSFTIPSGAKHLIITYNTSGNAVNALAISSMTVAGDNGALFGNESTWTPSATANDMVLQSDGTYKFEKSGVALSAGAVNFKACANHAWTNAWPSDNYSLSILESGNYTITIIFNPATLTVSATADLEQAGVVIPTIQLHSNITNPSWESSANFTLAGNEETASLTLTGVTKGNYEFGVNIDGTWTSNGSAFTRADNSHAIVSGSGNCTFNADRNGDYTFTWTYATNTLVITYPAIPAQSVTLTGLDAQILKGTEVNFTASSSGIDEPGYRFYVKEKNSSYGAAVASYTFDAIGEYVVKVEALEYNTGDPVADDESEVLVYDEHTFANGTTIYVDFSAMTEGAKGVNYPKANAVGVDYDAAGAGTFKTVTFTTDVTWTTMEDAFIKTEKASWTALKFSVPGEGKNCVVVAADGASFSWGTHVPEPDSYTVVGSVPGLDWDETSTTNDMSESGGIYTLVLEDVTLAATIYQYKMVKNHSWDVAYPQEGNASFTITTAGIYDLTFTLDLSASPVYSVTPTLIQEAVVTPIVKMFGTFADGSTWADTQEFTVAGNNESASLTIENLPAGYYDFKVVVGSSYLGNGYTYHRDYTGASNIGDGDDMTLNADIDGDYTFTWTYADNSLNIEFPTATTTTYHLYVCNLTDWDFFDVYAWGNKEYLGGWPGKANPDNTSTLNGVTYNVYDFTVIDGVSMNMNLMFHNNVGENLPGDIRKLFTVDEARDYYIIVTNESAFEGQLNVYERSGLTIGNYGTIILPYESTAIKGATLFSIDGKTADGDNPGNEGGLYIVEESKLLKGVPYFFLTTESKLQVYFSPGQSFEPREDHLYTTNGLVGFIGENETDEYTVASGAHNFILYNNGLWFVDSTVKIKSNRAYVDWSNVGASSPAPGRTRHLIGVHNVPTAIDNVQGDKVQGVKFIENGQLFIIKNGVKYNAQGLIVK